MNYRSSALAELDVLTTTFKDYSVGQILKAIINRKPKDISVDEWLYTVSDEDLYTEIERTKLIESEDGIIK